MASDRVGMARKIIQSQLQQGERANQIGRAGFMSTGGPVSAKWIGREARATFDVRVEVGGVKSL